MSSHQELADFIKKVHLDLRLRTRKIGPSSAWQEHCQDSNKLEKYASVMRQLALDHWEKKNGESSERSRIYWVMNEIEWYFYNNGYKYFLEKETKLAHKFSVVDSLDLSANIYQRNVAIPFLDVGSCYNPFSKFSNLDVTAIDLSPANELVLKCDFLSVSIGETLMVNGLVCNQLPINHFSVVLFSLLLEYLPSPEQRFDCCKKASMLLKKGGILIILTPDSKHATANAQLLKQWRFALATIGFILVQSRKLKHLWCLIFGKCHNTMIPQKWLSMQNVTVSAEKSIVIPQDNHCYDSILNSTVEQEVRSESDNKVVSDMFSNILADDGVFD